jgi:hypothetical protein
MFGIIIFVLVCHFRKPLEPLSSYCGCLCDLHAETDYKRFAGVFVIPSTHSCSVFCGHCLLLGVSVYSY